MPTTWQIEFFGQPAFPWWALVAAAAGIALVGYAMLALRENRRAAETGPGELRGPRPPSPLTPLLAAALGIVTIAITILMTALRASPHTAALLFTLTVATAAIFLFYQRVFRYLSPFRIAALFALRMVGLAALMLLLFQPVFALTTQNSDRPKLAIVIDASGSMSTYDQPNEPHRYRQAVLAARNILQPRLANLYDMQFFAYDGKHPQPLANSDEYDAIPPAGTMTDLLAAISLGTSAGAGKVILFSDGIHNGPTPLAAGAADLTGQIYTVKVGSTDFDRSTVPDIAVVNIDGPQTATVNNQVTLTAVIKSTALPDRTVQVFLKRVTGAGSATGGPADAGATETILDQQRLVLKSGPLPQTVQLKFTPDKVGRMVVRVQVPVDPTERSEANNQQDFPMLVTDPKLAVLYVEGRVRPEVGPLRRVLEQDPNINAVSMVQTTQGKFEMRGLKQGDDLQGLPTTLAQWKRFKIIVLGDLDSSFFNPAQLRDLAQAVKDGTGLLMIGGQNSFAPGKWNQTVLADLLPVELAAVDPPQINDAFVPQLTAAGAAHSVFKGIAQYFIQPGGQQPATQMPQLSGCVALAGPKPGATILAVHPTAKIRGQPAIVLAVEQYGNARTAAFAADTTWHWNLFLRGQGRAQDSPYNRFWGQLVRWLAGQEDLQKKTGASVTAMIPKERYEAGEAVNLRCAVTDAQGQATKFAQVFADITGPDAKTTVLPMTAVEDQIGVYEAHAEPRLAGAYQVTFRAAKDDAPLGTDKSSFIVLQSAGEMDTLAANPAALQLLAQNGGSYQDLSGPAMQTLADRLAHLIDPTALASHVTLPLYHVRSFFLIFIAALAAEWFLRRKWQLQ